MIVCTRNRRDLLAACLASISADGSRARRELIVVDNGSTDGTASVVARFAADCPHPVRIVHEGRAGQSRARNAGVRASTGEIVLFTDDDVLVVDGWIDAIANAFRPGVGAVGGRIVADFLTPPPDWMLGPQLDNAALIDYGPERFEMTSGRLPLGANLAVRRDLLSGLDQPFDERLGHSGELAIGYEETHLCEWLLKSHRIAYAPDAVIRHQVSGDRLRYATVRRRYYHLGFGLARHERLAGAPNVGLARGAVRALRTYSHAVGVRRRNARKPQISATDAHNEFYGYMWAGKHLEMLFGRCPGIARELARRLAR